jgi:DNA-binding beta-propeller fold protein YncE
VLLLAGGLNVPDDLLYQAADGSVLVGEHGSGRIAKVGGATGLKRLGQKVPLPEGIAQIGGTIYVADQLNNRVVALTSTGIRTVIQLVPDPAGLNLDGIDADGKQLVIPDSPHGTVLFVDPSGRVTFRQGGFGRPAGVWAQGGTILVADENLSAVFELKSGGGFRKLAGNLPGADDVVRDSRGHVLVTLPEQGILRDVTSGGNVARGMRNPQGLGFDGSQNLLVTESDAGRLDLIVRTFAIQVPTPAVKLLPGQGVCLGILRASGFTASLTVESVTGATVAAQSGTSASLEVVPEPCAVAICTVSVVVGSPSGRQFAYFTYRD